MKILLYTENENLMPVEGAKVVFKQQVRALESMGIEYTTDPFFEAYDILHINSTGINSNAVIANARRKNKKVVYQAKNTEEDLKERQIISTMISPLYKTKITSLYNKADLVIAPLPYTKKLLESYGVKTKIEVIPMGVDLSLFKEDEEKTKAFYKYFSFKKEDEVVLGIGQLDEKSGFYDFVDVARLLPQYKFIWLGKTPSFIMANKPNSMVQDLPYNVSIPGYVDQAIYQGALMNASCLFNPAYNDTDGTIILDAMAARCPMILRDIPSYQDLLDDSMCIKKDHIDDFTMAIMDVIDGEVKLDLDQAYEVAKKNEVSTIGKKLKEVYEQLLER